jgi:homopolymeric O-antigen transport system ATP-binding protein
MSHSAISVSGLSKEYVVGEQVHGTLYDLLTASLSAPLRRLRGIGRPDARREPFWALREVSFVVEPGEVVGIVGRNGAGKSTLLKILSRITAPTEGRVELRGRVASLLEVGTGFHPELSGRENIFLNGAILGMTRAEVARKFDEIVAFAEVDRFVDTPVKRYSSGMYVRLAFAVAAHLETDVLLVDEVLAVGDASFQRKSLGKMSDAAKSGRTVLFVSHNLSAIRNLCARALLFEGGALSFNGNVDEGLARYERSFSSAGGLNSDARFEGPLAGQLRFDQLVCLQGGQPAAMLDPLQEFRIELRGTALRQFPAMEVKLGLFRDGLHIASCHDTPQPAPLREGAFLSTFRVPAGVFRPGRYTIGAGAVAALGSWTWGSDVAALDFSGNVGGLSADRIAGLVSIPYEAQRIQ